MRSAGSNSPRVDQHRPDHRLETFADDRQCREVNQDRTKQRESDADTAENKVFPRRFQRLMGTVNTDHQYRRERGELDRHPHHPNIVGDQGEIHRKHQT